MFCIAEAMVRWLAPILSFTAEEIWKYMPGARNESVFFNTWAALPQGAAQRPQIDWDALLRVRSGVMRELEKLRNATRSVRRSTPRSTSIARRTCCRSCSRWARS